MFQGFGPPLRGAAIDTAETEFRVALERVAATQREIDALLARRAREVAAVTGAAERVEIVSGASGASTAKTAEFVHRSARAELAIALRQSEHATERMLVESAVLVESLSLTLTAVAEGRLAWRAAALIAEGARGLHDGTEAGAAAIETFEACALELAGRIPPARLRSRLNALRDRLEAVPPAERHAAARAERYVALEDAEHGMSWLHAFLPSVEAHAIVNRLTDVAHAAQDLDAEDGFDDPRTIDQRRADLLADYLSGDHVRVGDADDYVARVARGRDFGRFAGIRPTVVVTVPVQTLLDHDIDRYIDRDIGADPGGAAPTIPAMLDGVVPIDPATARELTANAPGLYRLLTDPHSGASLDLSRTRYQPSTELRLWLRLRDETCRFPGCGRLAKGCDVDHTVDWQYGGPTSAANLAHLCRGHHTLKHRTRWRMRQHADGAITWTGPSGKEYSTMPANAFASGATRWSDVVA